MIDVNDNSPIFVRMIVLPDQGVRVSTNEPDTEASFEGNDVLDMDDTGNQPPSARRSPLLLVPENATIGAPIIRLLAEDKDEGRNAAITYSLGNETVSGDDTTNQRRYFHLDPRSAEISVARGLAAESNVRLLVLAKDPGGLFDNITIRIHVADVNDHPPAFDKSWYTFDVAEGSYAGYTLGTVRAVDADHGENANVTYELTTKDDSNNLGNQVSRIFEVGPRDGMIRVTGVLDRETVAVHRLVVTARDNGVPRLSSTVEVEVNVLDVNDNPPVFHDYDEIERGDNGDPLPVYHASILENSPIGSQVIKVSANDSDFAGNGNGLILFDLNHRGEAGKQRFFAIDSKEGVITVVGNLDYERQGSHRLLVTASDLGSPVSLTSTAAVIVTVLNVDEEEGETEARRTPSFKHRYYEVEVEENVEVPVLVARLELADGHRDEHIRYSIVADETKARERFSIDPRNGSLYLMAGLDREVNDRYEAKVRVDRVKIGRGMPVMIYPVVGERLNGLAPNEARVVVRVKDVNDNAPRFKSKGRPILAAIPTTAHYGYEVVKVEVGLNESFSFVCRKSYRVFSRIVWKELFPNEMFLVEELSRKVRIVKCSFIQKIGKLTRNRAIFFYL